MTLSCLTELLKFQEGNKWQKLSLPWAGQLAGVTENQPVTRFRKTDFSFYTRKQPNTPGFDTRPAWKVKSGTLTPFSKYVCLQPQVFNAQFLLE